MTRPLASRELGSTYRIQLNGVGFASAASMVPALAALGVETLYVSPITTARSGSPHGYDVVDPRELDPALGTRGDFDDLLDALAEHRMRLLIDIVPNHQAVSAENHAFVDVLRRGRRSQYAGYFDIDWDAADGRIVLCVLDGSLPDALDQGAIRVVRGADPTSRWLEYGGRRFPLDPAGDEEVVTELTWAADPYSDADRRQLEVLLSNQHFRLEDWRLAPRVVNYRRFFDINDLIGIRQEDPAVFAATHALVVELAADDRVAGVRVDHVDGLRDPGGYLESLRAALPVEVVVEVEKIVEADEALPGWPVDGTTGYEFAAMVTGLFVEPAGAEDIRAEQATATGDSRPFRQRAVEAKRRAIDTTFPGSFDRVATGFARLLDDLEPGDVAAALAELTAQLAVYRTYRRSGEPASRAEVERMQAAAAAAVAELDADRRTAVERIVEVLLRRLDEHGSDLAAVMAWQQLTPGVTAKGVEDTALYDPGGLLVAADVGAAPDTPALAPAEFHQAMTSRQRSSPRAMSALSTHDSKRSHDVRCRLAALSEVAESWAESVAMLDKAATAIEIDAAERRYIYQTIVGAWPVSGELDDAFVPRVRNHLVKAAREAKRHSSWVAPDLEHEAALGDFVEHLIGDSASTTVEVLETVVTDIEHAAATNSMASVLVRAAAPGVPDIYQNDDSWFHALVDPDNRAPLDGGRLALVNELPDLIGLDLQHAWRDGRLKQVLIRAGLRLRRSQPALFVAADYRPIEVAGTHADHVVAFERRLSDESVVCVVPRLTRTLVGPGRFPTGECWADTAIGLPAAAGGYVDVLTGHRIGAGDQVSVATLLTTLPVALLHADGV